MGSKEEARRGRVTKSRPAVKPQRWSGCLSFAVEGQHPPRTVKVIVESAMVADPRVHDQV